jgi:predicted NBD/HSP70 family sugar kinase
MTLLFNLIRKNMPISRAQLAEMTGLSPTTVSMLVEELIESKWIRETGPGDSVIRGRKPIMLNVNAAGGYIATVEILSRGFICSLYDICFRKLGDIRVRDANVTADRVSEEIRALLKAKRAAQYRLLGIHVLFPGLFDPETGSFKFSAVLPLEEFIEKDLILSLRDRFPEAEVRISNVTRVIAFREFMADDYVPGTRLLSVNIDEGISASVVIGDAHKDINSCFPLEIGHIIVERNGLLCKCSNHGCLETRCSTVALFRDLNERTPLKLTYSESFGAEMNAVAMKKVLEAFCAKEPSVLKVMEEFCFTLCCGLVSVVNLFDIQSIHIGGSILLLGEEFIEMVRDAMAKQFKLSSSSGRVSVDGSESDYESMRCAAVMMSMDEIFKNLK